MEIIFFYLPHILIGAFLSIVLGLYGSHLVAREKTLEIVFVGQTIQIGILMGVLISNLLFDSHDDHGFHIEMLSSGIFTVIFYLIYERVTKSKKFTKTPFLVLLYTSLIAFSYLIIAASPLIESHMVKSFLGDIVTASSLELKFISLMALFSLFYYVKNKQEILSTTFDIALFGHQITNKVSKIPYFNIIVLLLMVYSIHVLGIVFTLTMMILPVTIIQFSNSRLNSLELFIYLISPISVITGFCLNIKFEQFPTSSLITLSLCVISLLFIAFRKLRG